METALKSIQYPSAKKLILGLLLAAEGYPLSAREAISACALFDITENNVRVTLARLSADGLIKTSHRGSYVLGPAASGVAAQVSTWNRTEARLQRWNGGFIAVFVGDLGRSDRKALVARERALNFLGLRELRRGLYIRPDNLSGGVTAIRERLIKLGAEQTIIVFTATEFSDADELSIQKLWDARRLEKFYKSERRRLTEWLDRHERLTADEAAIQSYLLGGQAIRHLVYDPWLPEEWIDIEARHRYVETVARFDAAGKKIWNARSTAESGMPIAPAAQPMTSLEQSLMAIA